MANNLFALRPNVVICKASISFVDMGFTTSNILIVYEIDSVLKSWRPDRLINGITGITDGKGYYIIPKIDLDMEEYFGVKGINVSPTYADIILSGPARFIQVTADETNGGETTIYWWNGSKLNWLPSQNV